MMVKYDIIAQNLIQPALIKLKTEVHVIKCHTQSLIKTAGLLKHSAPDHHACCRNTDAVITKTIPSVIIAVGIRIALQLMRRSCRQVRHARMLDQVRIRIEQLGSDRADMRKLRLSEHGKQPVVLCHFAVVV